MTTLRLDINHLGLGMELTQLAFPSDITLAKLKDKMYPKTGVCLCACVPMCLRACVPVCVVNTCVTLRVPPESESRSFPQNLLLLTPFGFS